MGVPALRMGPVELRTMKSRHGILGVTVNVRDATAAQCARADKALRPLRERVGYTHTPAHEEVNGFQYDPGNLDRYIPLWRRIWWRLRYW